MSFVLMSPSMEIMLKVSATISLNAPWSNSPSMAASVVIKVSIVAMFGQIMPEPLAIAPIRTSLPPSSIFSPKLLAWVSVVIMAFEASGLPSTDNFPTASLMPAVILSMGRLTPITPVEATNTSSAAQPICSAAIFAVSFAAFIPVSPVQAFAQPAFATMARAL